MDQETQAMYEKRLKEMRDIKNVEDYARKMAIAEGLAEGLAEGREKGLAEGRDQERERFAANFLKLNVPMDIYFQGNWAFRRSTQITEGKNGLACCKAGICAIRKCFIINLLTKHGCTMRCTRASLSN